MSLSVLVTGGAGYIGSVTVERLTDAGRPVVVLDDLSKGHRAAIPDGVPLVVGDFGDMDVVVRVIREHEVSSVIHFAALSLVGESMERPSDYFDVNVVRGCRLLAAMRSEGVKEFVFSSSAGVYGEPESVPIEESHATRPVNVYGETKRSFERVLEWQARSWGLAHISLRYFNAAGASANCGEDHDPETHLIPLALAAASGSGSELTIFGSGYPTHDGTCVRDYVDVRDLADAHIAALDNVAPGNSGVYNLGNGQGFSVLDVLGAVERVTGSPVPRRTGPRREGDPATLVASCDLAMKELGWRPAHGGLEDMIGSAWEWMKRHPEGYGD